SQGTTEEQDVAIGVFERKTPQAVFRILQWEWLPELHVAGRELRRQRVRIRYEHERIPPCNALLDVAGVVGHRRHAHGLEQNLRTASANNAKEDVTGLRHLERDLKAEPIAVERQ